MLRQLLRRIALIGRRAAQPAVSDAPVSSAALAAQFDLCQRQGDTEGAIRALERALELQPGWVAARSNLGVLLLQQGRTNAAEAAFREVITRDPCSELAYRMLGSILHRQARIDELLQVLGTGRRALPDSFELESLELFALNFAESSTAKELFERHRAFGERLERAVPARKPPFAVSGDPDRTLRVGFVSGDFKCHPVTLFVLPLLERFEPARVTTVCYSVGTSEDEFTRRIAASAGAWRAVGALSEEELAATIAQDAIDILVDLSGHSGSSRLGVFARWPAPVQATWLGYLNTTGLTRIGYRITDPVCDPPGLTDALHTEHLVRLPHSQWCYRPFMPVTPASAPPCARNGFVTFGSFNQVAKFSESTLALWARILRQLPGSRLRIAGLPPGTACDRILRVLAQHGIPAGRISASPHVPVVDYYAAYGEVDVALDTTPYSGGTTTCDSLWMGVPVITLPGKRPASRSAASILTTIGLGGWIASSPDDYVERAAGLARRTEELQDLRLSLRPRMLASPLMDEVRFARNLESVLRELWRMGCATGS